MAVNDTARPADPIARVTRALRSLDLGGLRLILPTRAKKPRVHRSLRSALRALFETGGAKATDRRLKLVLGRLGEAMLEGIAIYGREGEIVYANENLCQMLGRSRVELVGQPAAEHFGDIYARVCSARGGERFETELRTKAGRTIVIEACGESIYADDASPLGALAVMIDITSRATALRRSESEVRLLSAQVMAAQELERQRMARELHDGIGQALSGVKFTLDGCEALITRGMEQGAIRVLRQLSERVQGVLDEVRRVSMNLRPATLDDLGILPTLGWFTREFRAIYEELELETHVDVCEEEIAAPLKTAIYRIVQEAFNNVVRHSDARKVSLVLRRRAGYLELQVHDDGAGFDAAERGVADESERGLGLATMRERAEVTGGRFALRSEPGRGTTVSVAWPSYRPRAPQEGREG